MLDDRVHEQARLPGIGRTLVSTMLCNWCAVLVRPAVAHTESWRGLCIFDSGGNYVVDE